MNPLDILYGAGGAWFAAALTGLLAGRVRSGLLACCALSAVGGAAAAAGGGWSLVYGNTPVVTPGGASATIVGGPLELQMTSLAGVFVALLGVVAVAIAWYAPRYHEPARGTGVYLAAYNLALLACLAVLAAGGMVTFLVAWETMSLACYLIILRHPRSAASARGAFWFLALSEIGFLLVVAAFVILSAKTHATRLDAIAAGAHLVPGGWRAAAYLLALVGFGFKAGLVPLHVWLPEAHPVAPADGSTFLSGVVVKLGVYGIALFAFRLVPVGGAWPGLVTMGGGAISAAIGILYALGERDIKRFLAYSTIENTGIIVTAFGAAMIFHAYRQPALYAFLLHRRAVPRRQPRHLQDAAVPGGRGGRARDRNQGHGPARRPGAPAAAQRGDHVRRDTRHRGAAAAERVRQRMADLPGAVPGLPHRQPPDRHPDRARPPRPSGSPEAWPSTRSSAASASRTSACPAPGRPPTHRENGQPIAGPALLAVACVALAVGAPVVLAGCPAPSGRSPGSRSARCCCPATSPSSRRTRTSPPSPPPTWRCSSSPRAPSRCSSTWRAGRGPTASPCRSGTAAWSLQAADAVLGDDVLRADPGHLRRPVPAVGVASAGPSDDPAGRSGPVHYEAAGDPALRAVPVPAGDPRRRMARRRDPAAPVRRRQPLPLLRVPDDPAGVPARRESEEDDTVQAPTRPRRVTWLLLAYRLPANSGMKAAVRRRLTAIERSIRRTRSRPCRRPRPPNGPSAGLRSMIGEAGGSAQVLRAEAIEASGTWLLSGVGVARTAPRLTRLPRSLRWPTA